MMYAKSGASFKNNFVRLPKIDLPHFDGSYQCGLNLETLFLHSNSGIDNITSFIIFATHLEAAHRKL